MAYCCLVAWRYAVFAKRKYIGFVNRICLVLRTATIESVGFWQAACRTHSVLLFAAASQLKESFYQEFQRHRCGCFFALVSTVRGF